MVARNVHPKVVFRFVVLGFVQKRLDPPCDFIIRSSVLWDSGACICSGVTQRSLLSSCLYSFADLWLGALHTGWLRGIHKICIHAWQVQIPHSL